jgi:hypothetical protein
VRRRFALALLLASAVALSGCAQLVDVNHRALVLGAGIDTAPSGGEYNVSLQYPLTQQSSGGGGTTGGGSGGGQLQFKTVEALGINVGSALTQLREQTDRFIYLGNLSVIALGAPLAEKNVLVPLDYFIRSGEVSEPAQVVVAQPDATGLLHPPSPEGVALPLFQYLRRSEVIQVATAPDPISSHNCNPTRKPLTRR